MTKLKSNNKHYAQSSIYALLRSGYCVYLFAPKSNWYDLEDNDGNKLKIPPAWQCGSCIDSDRINDHFVKNKKLTENQFGVSPILRYMKENNLKMEDNYYFDIYVLDFTDFLWHFSRVESEFWLNRKKLMPFKDALEHYIKTHLRKFFVDVEPPLLFFWTPDEMVVNGTPVIDRFIYVWGTGDDYLNYSIEKITGSGVKTKRREVQTFRFLRKLYYSNRRDIVVDALTPITIEQLKERQRQRSEKRKDLVDVDEINNKKLLS